MKIEKLPSGSYRVRKTYNKKTYSLVFDHKPTQKEINEQIIDRINKGSKNGKKTLYKAMCEYIESRNNVVSPSTLRSYNTLLRSLSDIIKDMDIYEIEQIDIQHEINRYSSCHSAKSTRNYHGLISAVLGTFRPSMVINTTLPQKRITEHYRPTEDDVKRILEASAGSDYHIAFQLGVMGLRRGEVAGIDIDTDINGNELHIHQVLVESEDGWVIKDVPKNDTSNRTIVLPEKLINEIHHQGYIVKTSPPMIVHELHSYQDQLGIPQFRFHDLRHYFASYCHANGIPDVYIMEMGGWKTTHTMNKIYKESMEKKSKEVKEMVAKNLLL